MTEAAIGVLIVAVALVVICIVACMGIVMVRITAALNDANERHTRTLSAQNAMFAEQALAISEDHRSIVQQRIAANASPTAPYIPRTVEPQDETPDIQADFMAGPSHGGDPSR